MNKVICQIFRSPKKEGMYLYVEKAKGLNDVPAELLEQFGKPQPALVLLLGKDRTLAGADAEKVLAAIADKGFYLQIPPPEDSYMQEINLHNSKLV